MFQVKERVRAGMTYLDRTNPGWESRPALDGELNVGHEHSCMLARLDQTKFRTARNLRGLSNEQAAELGFYARTSSNPDGSYALHEYSALSIEWMRQRDMRRANVILAQAA